MFFNQLRSMELGRCLKPVDVIIILVMVLIWHVHGGLSIGYRHANVTRCVEREREALLAIKGDLVDESDLLSSWGEAQNQQDCCTWEGVYCDNQTGHVAQLHLGAKELKGTISPKLTELYHLKYLDLSYNYFDGQIPTFIGSLSNLRYFDASESGFVGRLPYHQLGNLTHLQYLNLGSNSFAPAVENLNWLSHLSSLKYLDLSLANLSKASNWLETINKLPNLRTLILKDCELPPPILSTLSHINSSNPLTSVVLSVNPFGTSSTLLKWLSNYNSTLVDLQLSSTHLSVIPDALANMRSLKVLDLSDNQISHLVPNIFAKLSSLSNIYFSRNQISGLIPNIFGNMSSLTDLDLSSNQISGLISNVFRNISSLEILSLSDNPLEGGITKHLSHLCSLQSLAMSGCRLNQQLSELLQILSCAQHSLHTFDLSGNNLTGSTSNLPNFLSLEKLLLHENQLSGMIPESIGNLSSLQLLSLRNNRLSGVIPESVGKLSSLLTIYLNENLFNGTIPESMGKLSSLEQLYLYGNQLSGRIPESIGQLSKLIYLDLSKNSLTGVISETHFSNLSELVELDFSFNLLDFNVTSDWVPPFQLDILKLRYNKVGPYFPKWLRTQTVLTELDLSYAEISDVLPSWFWGLGIFHNVDLSHNRLRGTIEDSSFEDSTSITIAIQLSSNQLEGPIPSILSEALFLDLSYNNFSNMTSFLCGPEVTSSRFLNLSSNHFPAELPDCWGHFMDLKLLDLSNNAFSGKIPISLGSLSLVETLKLKTNNFVGELPSSLKNCESLTVIDLGENRVSGLVPQWLGVSFPNLVILMLQSNHFSGRLPSQLCNLTHIQILDLSLNEISGTIPRCLNGLTSLAQEENSNLTITHSLNYSSAYNPQSSYDDDATFMWKGVMSSYKSTLGLVKRIDLSSNILTGGIPSEITRLVGLVSLNLSRNHLTGQIPHDIGKLQLLDSLDFSRNRMDGRIPASLAQIHRLSYLDLSYNHLSAEIPLGTQLQGFDPSSYAGNPELCGLPLPKMCAPDQDRKNVSSHEEDRDELITQGFYISAGFGFAAGFWGICGILIFKRSWRYAYYTFLNALGDWLYVTIAVISQQVKDKLDRKP